MPTVKKHIRSYWFIPFIATGVGNFEDPVDQPTVKKLVYYQNI